MATIGRLNVTKMCPDSPGLMVAELATASTPQAQAPGLGGSGRTSLISKGLGPVFLNLNWCSVLWLALTCPKLRSRSSNVSRGPSNVSRGPPVAPPDVQPPRPTSSTSVAVSIVAVARKLGDRAALTGVCIGLPPFAHWRASHMAPPFSLRKTSP